MSIVLSGSTVQCYCDDELVIVHPADVLQHGRIGLWTKADSVVWFKALSIGNNGGQKVITFK